MNSLNNTDQYQRYTLNNPFINKDWYSERNLIYKYTYA